MATPSVPLPLVPRLAAWLGACLAGRVGPDDFAAEVVGPDVRHLVLDEDDSSIELDALPARLGGRRARVGCALPVPGDPLGLAGPPDFNHDAIEAGGAVLVAGPDLGLVPTTDARTMLWRLRPARPAAPLDPAEQDRALRRELSLATARLAELDVAAWRPQVADLLTGALHARPRLPRGWSSRSTESVTRALLCREVVELALADDGGTVSSTQAQQRRTALAGLDRAARRVLVSTCGTVAVAGARLVDE